MSNLISLINFSFKSLTFNKNVIYECVLSLSMTAILTTAIHDDGYKRNPQCAELKLNDRRKY